MPPALALAGVASGHTHRADERATFAAALAAGLLAVAESECRRIELGSSDTHISVVTALLRVSLRVFRRLLVTIPDVS
jgi:hypothetical protein